MQKVFACFDIKAAAYGALICAPTRGLASRAFADACADPRSPMAQYPGDFALHELGEYDPATGQISGHARPEIIAQAAQFVGAKVEPVVPAAIPVEEVKA